MSKPRDTRPSPVDWPRLLRQARRDARARFGEFPDLEDLVQDALLLLILRGEGVENPRAWVAGTVWRLVANSLRLSHSGCLIQSGEADAAHLPCNLDLRLDLDSAARRLAQHERCLLALVAEGLSHGEIAERLSLGWKSVGSRVQRLRRKLGLLLADASGWRKRLR